MKLKKTVLFCVMMCFLGITGFSAGVDVIKNPKPTVTEKDMLTLEVYKTLNEELGDDQFLFSPGSLSVRKFIFVYDRAQARIYKLDKELKLVTFFGRKGQGPAEFYGTGKYAPVFLKIGQDNNLYAHDYRPRRILGFSPDGKPIASVNHKKSYLTNPIVDKNGSVLLAFLRNGKIVIESAKGKIIGEFTVPGEYLNYLFAPPPSTQLKKPEIFIESAVKCSFTADSKLLLFLKKFSTLVIVTDNKVSGTLKLWPAGALKEYKKQLTALLSKKNPSYAPMFARIIPDQDNKDVVYFQQGSSSYNGKKGDTLFAFNLKGELLKTYFIPFDSGRVIFFDKRDNIFYAVHGGEVVILLKEKNHE
jgi:hypothetical protein